MNFDRQYFFIGLMDFFSILLPGALPTYLLMGKVGPVVLGDRYAKLAGAQAWVGTRRPNSNARSSVRPNDKIIKYALEAHRIV